MAEYPDWIAPDGGPVASDSVPDPRDPDEKLAALLGFYDDAKDAAEHATSVLDRLTEGIKRLAREVYPDAAEEGLMLENERLRTPLVLTCRYPQRVVTATLKAKYPSVYEECSRATPTWYLQRKRP